MLETLFALVILTTGFFSAFALLRKSISVTQTSINQLIAANLAQEGIEIVRNMRDSIYVEGDDWGVVVDNGHLNQHGCLVNPINCEVDIDINNKKPLDEDDNAYLKVDSNDQYQYSSGVDSKFRRWVNLTQGEGFCTEIATADDCIMINVDILWSERGNDFTFSVEDYIYNFY